MRKEVCGSGKGVIEFSKKDSSEEVIIEREMKEECELAKRWGRGMGLGNHMCHDPERMPVWPEKWRIDGGEEL